MPTRRRARRSLIAMIVLASAGCGGAAGTAGPPAPPPAPPPPPPPPGPPPSPPALTVMVDEAHFNYHTLPTTLAPLGVLVHDLGYFALRSKTPFLPDSLARGRVLVISNALHSRNAGGDWSLPTPSAFSGIEIQVVRQWVEAGGSLFLIADHMPFPGAAAELALAFGIRLHNGFAFDTTQLSQPSPCLRSDEIQIFRRSDGSLRDHPITNGRSAAERVDSIGTFTGEAFEPGGAQEPLMVFGPSAVQLLPNVAWQFTSAQRVPVADWLQGAVLRVGQGRVAVFGEAAMFTEQTCGGGLPMGMNAPAAAQNRQLLMNLLRWLFGTL